MAFKQLPMPSLGAVDARQLAQNESSEYKQELLSQGESREVEIMDSDLADLFQSAFQCRHDNGLPVEEGDSDEDNVSSGL